MMTRYLSIFPLIQRKKSPDGLLSMCPIYFIVIAFKFDLSISNFMTVFHRTMKIIHYPMVQRHFYV